MHNIEFIRQNPDIFDLGLKRRGLDAQSSTILKIDSDRRNAQTERDDKLASRNALSKQVGEIKKQGGDASEIINQVHQLKNDIATLEQQEAEFARNLQQILEILPNLPASDVPDGKDENDNALHHRFDEPKLPDFPAKEHADIGEDLGLLDFHYAAKISGARFAVKYGDLAKLERAIANFMLTTHTEENGYLEVDAPVLVHQKTLYGSGHLPKFKQDLYKIEDSELYLIPTSETVLASYAAGQILDPKDLPIRITAWTNCFRSEAGAAGRDTRGLIRMHQFSKVELVSIVDKQNSFDELENMRDAAESILKKLELPFRTVTLCIGDMGFAATKTYDIEVWLPGSNNYREISSCSNCLDFQSRRMNARVRLLAGERGTEFPHMLNGSGLAVGRTMVAILENYQNADGTVTIPDILRPFMGGQTKITFATHNLHHANRAHHKPNA